MQSAMQFTNHSKTLLFYHICFATKGREQLFLNPNSRVFFNGVFRTFLEEKQKELKWFDLISFSLEIDHLHFFVQLSPNQTISHFVNIIKSNLALEYNNKCYVFSKPKLDHVWQTGYYCASVGRSGSNLVKKYIENQSVEKFVTYYTN